VATLSRLIDDLLDISQIQSDRLILNYVEMNLETVLREIIESFSEHLNLANCKITVTLEKSVIVYWDRCRFEQVIYNLLSNLVKYAPNSIASFSIQKKQNTVILIVADNGPGIAQEAHDKIFECFERATPDPNIAGLGIGLFIVKRIIEAHRGTAQLDHSSKPTKFIIELPINPTTMVQTGTTGWANGVDYGVEKHSFNRR
jgi:signal transduction histidine kinase